MHEIRPINNNGFIQLKFTVRGQRYSIATGGQYNNRMDMAKAQVTATQIYLDVQSGHFDGSLDSYRVIPKKPVKPMTHLLDLWDLWVDSLESQGHHHRWTSSPPS